ncbi:carbonic anhydrase isoform X2 [Nematostella vectensis]|uniref:carbonic anhydrase isoform X2 n=1 Tax=Nematostella vectensis TaxID=45351 RepID=UPI00207791C3|nr:carbonic anhydrase isoform X2 [Nematostella vectensis]
MSHSQGQFGHLGTTVNTMQKALVVLSLLGASLAADWDYDSKGPSKWSSSFSQCNGSSQSPIDIITSSVAFDQSLGELQFVNFDTIPTGSKISLKNNGHAFQVNMLSAGTFTVSGGGLGATYSTVQFHLHWGSKNEQGSEHLIDGKAFAGAVHIVSYNTKYPNISAAVDKSDGLAVVGILLKVGTESAALKKFMENIGSVTKVNTSDEFAQPAKLGDLLPSNKDFYRYQGSLTTPGCQESVTWSVMANPITVSEAQLTILRGLKQKDGVAVIQDNFRNTMPLNGRAVKSNFKAPTSTPPPPVTTQRAGARSALACMATAGLVVLAALMI